MINSMTGFGAHRQPVLIAGKAVALVHVELRSINSRFLDVLIRCPDELRFAETMMREVISKKMSRGKIECRIFIQRDLDTVSGSETTSGTTSGINSGINSQAVLERFNATVLQDLLLHQELIKQQFAQADLLSVKDILNWPGVLKQDDVVSAEVILNPLQLALEEALASLLASRAIEGEALGKSILDRAQKMADLITQIEPLLPQIIQGYQDKLSEKLLGVLAGIDQQVSSLAKGEVADRIRQEIVLYGVKIDIDEEISRLKIHIQAIRNALQKGGPVGKRLDFLMQELQRESNTLGAKSVSQETSDAAIELKLLVEQIREQVQNLE
ncbi:MAG: YicC family protein [Betaproteobacteria bacterium]|nr:YicC family protein [Betaproteobacteria bacterium]